ncbi:MAG TPA: hypothetical protein VHE37_05050, partial [Nevskiaceae bacterium]|nr:hypothetical protein [Nevskiaceae bacterium]
MTQDMQASRARKLPRAAALSVLLAAGAIACGPAYAVSDNDCKDEQSAHITALLHDVHDPAEFASREDALRHSAEHFSDNIQTIIGEINAYSEAELPAATSKNEADLAANQKTLDTFQSKPYSFPDNRFTPDYYERKVAVDQLKGCLMAKSQRERLAAATAPVHAEPAAPAEPAAAVAAAQIAAMPLPPLPAPAVAAAPEAPPSTAAAEPAPAAAPAPAAPGCDAAAHEKLDQQLEQVRGRAEASMHTAECASPGGATPTLQVV